MKKLLIGLFTFILFLTGTKTTSMSDCEYFVYPLLGINQYTSCLQNPEAYSSYFVYHTVEFYDGTTLLASKEVRDRDTAIAPTTPTKTGYEFVGWDTVLTNVRSDRTISAVWKQMITLTYLDYNGTVLKQEMVDPGGTGTPPIPPNRSGFTFSGWSGSYSNVSQNSTLIAQYYAESYTVKFYTSDSTVINTQTVNHMHDAVAPTPPLIEGKVFTGWSVSFQNVTSNLNVYAEYDDIYYQVQFHHDGITDTMQVVHGGIPVAPSVTKPGYDFLGWEPALVPATVNAEYTASYAKHKYTVTFYDQFNEILETQFVEYQGSAVQPSFQEPIGMMLKGWSESIINVQSDLSVYPVLETATYLIQYRLEDGTPLFEETVTYGKPCIGEMPTREGYIFSHLSSNCQSISEDMTIVAYYTPLQFTVRFLDFEDKVVLTQLVNYGEDAIAPLVSDIPRYVVTGWSGALTNIKADIDLKPSGYIRTYRIVFKDYDGSDLCITETEYGQSVTCEEPTREGYLFESWSDTLLVTENKTIFPVYVRKEFTIDYYLFNQLLKTETVGYQQSGTPPFVSRTGYDFVEWSTSTNHVTKNLSVYAILQKQTFEVTYKDYDFSIMKVETVDYGEDGHPPVMDRLGYDFQGWSGLYDSVTADLTLIALYEPKIYTVSFYFEDTLLKSEKVSFHESATEPELNLPGIQILGWSEDFQLIEQDMELYALTEENVLTVRFFEEDELLKEMKVPYGKSAVSPFTAQWSEDFSKIVEDMDVYLLDRDYPAGVFEIEGEAPVKITYFNHLGQSILMEEYQENTVPHLFELPGYKFVEWNMTTLEDGDLLAEPTLEVDSKYVEEKPIIQMTLSESKKGSLLSLKQGFHDYSIPKISVNGELVALDELTYQFDDLSQIDQTVNWILFPTLLVSEIDFVVVVDLVTQTEFYYDLRLGAEAYVYNLYDASVTLSPWNKFLIWLDQMM